MKIYVEKHSKYHLLSIFLIYHYVSYMKRFIKMNGGLINQMIIVKNFQSTCFFSHCIWDAYSFFVLSKDFFILNKSCRITFNQIIEDNEDSDNQYEAQVKKFKY